jgi:hypothetical protein
MAIDLTGGEVRVVGNKDDAHWFRLSNPLEQEVIVPEGSYSAEFSTTLNGSNSTSIELDLSEVNDGTLILPITIKNGFYIIRRLNPQRTLLTMRVEAQ